jgi:hypothetical protein
MGTSVNRRVEDAWVAYLEALPAVLEAKTVVRHWGKDGTDIDQVTDDEGEITVDGFSGAFVRGYTAGPLDGFADGPPWIVPVAIVVATYVNDDPQRTLLAEVLDLVQAGCSAIVADPTLLAVTDATCWGANVIAGDDASSNPAMNEQSIRVDCFILEPDVDPSPSPSP